MSLNDTIKSAEKVLSWANDNQLSLLDELTTEAKNKIESIIKSPDITDLEKDNQIIEALTEYLRKSYPEFLNNNLLEEELLFFNFFIDTVFPVSENHVFITKKDSGNNADEYDQQLENELNELCSNRSISPQGPVELWNNEDDQPSVIFEEFDEESKVTHTSSYSPFFITCALTVSTAIIGMIIGAAIGFILAGIPGAIAGTACGLAAGLTLAGYANLKYNPLQEESCNELRPII